MAKASAASADTVPMTDDSVDDVTKMDPDSKVKVKIHDSGNAGKSPITRFGRVMFDEHGDGEITVALKDVGILHSWGWLSVEDQETYLGLEAAQPQAIDVNVHNAELDAVKAANTKLAQRNADLEARLEGAQTQFETQFQAYQKATAERVAELEATAKADVYKLTTERDAAIKERDALKAQFDAMTSNDEEKKSKKGR